MTFMRVLSSFSVLLCVAAIAFYGWHKQSALPGSEGAAGWQLVWSDEFNYSGLPDAAKWGYDVGGSGWGNKELQYYTDRRKENARVENGHLIIEVRRDGFGNNEYTSARLTSKGKGDWTYGRFEVRAKLPSNSVLSFDWHAEDCSNDGARRSHSIQSICCRVDTKRDTVVRQRQVLLHVHE